MDTQFYAGSTSQSSSPSSRKGSQECYSDFAFDKKSKRSRRSAHRSGSFGLGSVTEESDDIEDILMRRIPHIQMPNDAQEFKEMISPRERQCQSSRKQQPRKRRASLSPNRTNDLAQVEEVIGDDDDYKIKCIFKLGLIFDKNEFNNGRSRKTSITKDRSNHDPNVPILEDLQENVKDKYIFQNPTVKLKVDEVDFEQDKMQWAPEEIIEVIEEERQDTIVNVKEKEMFSKVKKILHEERDFLKRILKGDMIQDDLIKKQEYQSQVGENEWNQLIQEAEECVNSDDDHQQ